MNPLVKQNKWMRMNRRNFITGVTAASASSFGLMGISTAQSTSRRLPILPLTDLISSFDDRVSLKLAQSNHDFGTGTESKTFGINNSYLGPVLRVKQGQTLPFNVSNELEEISTLHWHGLHIPGDLDGGPHQQIQPGETWSPDIAIRQHASMNWFHSHAHGTTAKQVYKGLVGVMVIEDDASLSADLPNTYGVDDFTLVLQDKTFDEAGSMKYTLTEAAIDDGFIGETLVVNGAIAPVSQTVPTGLVRLRLLNASNANFMTLSMANGPLNVIASDGGFLNSTVQTDILLMSPGERYEVLVDMKKVDINHLLVSCEIPGISGVSGVIREFNRMSERKRQIGGISGLMQELWANEGEIKFAAITLNRQNKSGFGGSIPKNLANLPVPNRNAASIVRSFELQQYTGADLAALAALGDNYCGDGSAMKINGKSMDMNRIDENIVKGDTEIWRMSVDDWRHPFHIHGCSFRILSQEGVQPPSYAQGWKDMVHVDKNGGWSEVLVSFDYDAPKNAPYMYHCHTLEHEDCGMMGQFTVT
jgi:FtsP/CotA-like multicopper oxidase with cupredoxin domain